MKAEKYAYDAMFLNSDAVPHLNQHTIKIFKIQSAEMVPYLNFICSTCIFIEEEFLMFNNSPINV